MALLAGPGYLHRTTGLQLLQRRNGQRVWIHPQERPSLLPVLRLIHNTRNDRFVRLALGIGDWWKHDSYEHRYALCLDATPRGKSWQFSVLSPVYSPQQNLEKFGQWLGRDADRSSPVYLELMEMTDFIVTHHPAVLTYLAGRHPDYTGRDALTGTEN